MFVTSKVFNSNVKSILSKVILNNIFQCKNDQPKNLRSSNQKISSKNSKANVKNLTKNINF